MEEAWIIERVISRRHRVVPDETGVGRQKIEEFLISWEGYGEEDSSWHTEDELYDLGAENFEFVAKYVRERKVAKHEIVKKKNKAKTYVANKFDEAYRKSVDAVDPQLEPRMEKIQQLKDVRLEYLRVERENIATIQKQLLMDNVYPGERTPAPILPDYVDKRKPRVRSLRAISVRALCDNIEYYEGYANLPMEWKRSIYFSLAKRGLMTGTILLSLLHSSQTILDLRPIRGYPIQHFLFQGDLPSGCCPRTFDRLAQQSPNLEDLTIDVQPCVWPNHFFLRKFTKLSRLHISTIRDILQIQLSLPKSLQSLIVRRIPQRHRKLGPVKRTNCYDLKTFNSIHSLPNLTELELSPDSNVPYEALIKLLQKSSLVKLRVGSTHSFIFERPHDSLMGSLRSEDKVKPPTKPPNRQFRLLDLQCPHLPSFFYQWLFPQPHLESLRLYGLAPSISLPLDQSPKLKSLFLVDCNSQLPTWLVPTQASPDSSSRWVPSAVVPFRRGALQWQSFPASVETLSLVQYLKNSQGSHGVVPATTPSLNRYTIDTILAAPNAFAQIELKNAPHLPIEKLLLLLKADLPLQQVWLQNVGSNSETMSTRVDELQKRSYETFDVPQEESESGEYPSLAFATLPFASLELRCYPLVTTLSLRSMYWITQDLCKKIVSPATFPMIKYLDLTALDLYSDPEDDGSFWAYLTNSFRLHTLIVGNYAGDDHAGVPESRLGVNTPRPYLNLGSVYNGAGLRVLEISSCTAFSWLDYEVVFDKFPTLHTFSLFGPLDGRGHGFGRLRSALLTPNVGRSLRVLAITGVLFSMAKVLVVCPSLPVPPHRQWMSFLAQSHIRDIYTREVVKYEGKNGVTSYTKYYDRTDVSYVRNQYACGGQYKYV